MCRVLVQWISYYFNWLGLLLRIAEIHFRSRENYQSSINWYTIALYNHLNTKWINLRYYEYKLEIFNTARTPANTRFRSDRLHSRIFTRLFFPHIIRVAGESHTTATTTATTTIRSDLLIRVFVIIVIISFVGCLRVCASSRTGRPAVTRLKIVYRFWMKKNTKRMCVNKNYVYILLYALSTVSEFRRTAHTMQE